jgi:hypothetical protein
LKNKRRKEIKFVNRNIQFLSSKCQEELKFPDRSVGVLYNRKAFEKVVYFQFQGA